MAPTSFCLSSVNNLPLTAISFHNCCSITGTTQFVPFFLRIRIASSPLQALSRHSISQLFLNRRQCFGNAAHGSDVEQGSETLLRSDADQAASFETSFPNDIEPPRLYVGNLPWSCDDQQLEDLFKQHGTVELAEVVYDNETGRSRGFAFVRMRTLADACEAIEKLDESSFGGRYLKVCFSDRQRSSSVGGPRTERLHSATYGGSLAGMRNKIYVGNLPFGVDDSSLESLFSGHGKVHEARVVCDNESGRSRGFGFVVMSSSAEAEAAVTSMGGAVVQGRTITVRLA